MSTTPLVYVLSFIFVLAILITVHEFGHFWVARRLGVKVLRFSIGFGAGIWSWRSRDGATEYRIAAIPLGGYVKMLDEREGEVREEERDQAFNNKSVYARMAIVLAGPAFNFIFAILVLWLMFMGGVPALKPVLGEVEAGSLAAAAGFEAGEQIVRMDDTEIVSWQSFRMELFTAVMGREQVQIEVQDDDGNRYTRVLYPGNVEDPADARDLMRKLGFTLWMAPAVLGEVAPDGAAAEAGLARGDRILSVDGEVIPTWSEWVEVVRAHPGQELQLEVERDGGLFDTTLTPAARLESDQPSSKEIGFVGVHFPEVFMEKMQVTVQYGPLESLAKGAEKTWDMSRLMLGVLWQMIMGEASLKNISGPLTIAQYAGDSATLGLTQFLSFLAIVSISLGVLNLLPIPILDGGHFLYYVIELLQGKALSEQVQEAGQRIGIMFILALMALAFYNDFMRLLG